MATKVSLINMKGGVGKSTITVNLAWQFAAYRNKRVLVVDLDPQFNSSQYLLGVTE
jgi:chromosome partitioning protein